MTSDENSQLGITGKLFCRTGVFLAGNREFQAGNREFFPPRIPPRVAPLVQSLRKCGLIRLLIHLHARHAACRLPEPARHTSPVWMIPPRFRAKNFSTCTRSPTTAPVGPRGTPRINRGRGGWLVLTPRGTLTSHSLPAFLAHTELGQSRRFNRAE
jgi:hypothetical protein